MNEQKFKNLAYFAVLLALAVVLPYAVHIAVAQGGKVLLPMHIPVQLAGFLISPLAGLLIGLIAPPLNFLLGGMPPFPVFIPMMFELGAMGFLCGLLGKKMNPLWALLIAIFISKFFLAFGWWFLTVVGVKIPIYKSAILGASFMAVVTGFPGIALQILIVPSLVLILRGVGRKPKSADSVASRPEK